MRAHKNSPKSQINQHPSSTSATAASATAAPASATAAPASATAAPASATAAPASATAAPASATAAPASAAAPADAEIKLTRYRSNANSSNYYERLGVKDSPETTASQIKTAYRKLALEFHPDKIAERAIDLTIDEATELYKKILTAYEVLSDSDQRKIYDRNNAASRLRRNAPFTAASSATYTPAAAASSSSMPRSSSATSSPKFDGKLPKFFFNLFNECKENFYSNRQEQEILDFVYHTSYKEQGDFMLFNKSNNIINENLEKFDRDDVLNFLNKKR